MTRIHTQDPRWRRTRDPRQARRRLGLATLTLVTAAALAACGSGDSEEPDAGSSSPAATPTPASAAPKPDADGCYTMTYDEALASTTDVDPVPCKRPHTNQTYDVGQLDTVVDGHLLAVDSDYVQQQPAEKCTPPLRKWLGGSLDDLRLSMLRPVWFTPTLEESDSGAAWYRCDVVAIAGGKHLATSKGSLEGALDTERGDRYAMCGTAAPDAKDFTRVMCGETHAWRAIQVVPLPEGKYPGATTVREAGQDVCNDAGRDYAADALDYDWGYEWPTEALWEAGQTYGLCWAPD